MTTNISDARLLLKESEFYRIWFKPQRDVVFTQTDSDDFSIPKKQASILQIPHPTKLII